MNKSQSESKFRSGVSPRPQVERRHNSHNIPRSRGNPPSYHPVVQPPRQQVTEEEEEEEEGGGGGGEFNEQGDTHLVEIVRHRSSGSLGLQLEEREGGVVVRSISASCQATSKGRLRKGDLILEVCACRNT